MKKRCLLYILTILLVVTSVPAQMYAEPVTENEQIEADAEVEIKKPLEVQEESVERNGLDEYLERNGIFNGTEASGEDYGSPEREMVSYPAKYDPRSAGLVSGVRSQVGGTCWLFAGMAAVESNLIKKGLATKDVDLSELQVAYFLFNPYVDRLGYYTNNTKQKYTVDNLWDYINGGSADNILATLSCWAAPVHESEASFYKKGTYVDIELTKEEINAVVLDEDLTDKEYWHFKGAKFCNYDVTEKSQNDIKYLLSTYGGVSVSYYDDSAYMHTVEEGGEASYYYPYDTNGMINHAVEIVGWDDNYPKENFVYPPRGDGAFLCKNSWGEVYDANWVQSNGFFWMSYYEREMMNVMAIEMDSADVYDNIYAYDGRCESGGGRGERATNLNIYTAKAYGEGTVEKVDGVMTYLFRNTPYELTLYLNPMVENGKLVSYSGKSKTFTGSSDFSGYYTIDTSSDPLYVPYGSTYGILIENENGNIGGAGGDKNVDFNTCFIGKDVNSLQDCKVLKVHIPTLRGLTNKAENFVPSSAVSLSHKSVIFESGESITLTGSVSPSNATTKSIAYYSTDDKVASVDDNGVVTAKGPGACVIYAYASDGNSVATCDVTVKLNSFDIKALSVKKGTTETMEPMFEEKFEFYPGNDAFEWEISDETIASIDQNGCVTGVQEGKARVRATYKRDKSLTAECEITVYSLAESITFGISNNMLSISEGCSIDISAVITPKEATSDIAYTISNPGYEVIRYENGILTAVAAGGASITAMTLDGTNLSETLEVNVWPSVATINYNFPTEGDIAMKAGEYQEVSVHIIGDNPVYEEYISVYSSNQNVVEVTKNIYNSFGMGIFEIKAISEGTATVTVKANDKDEKSIKFNITVGENKTQEDDKKDKNVIVVKDVKYRINNDDTLEICGVTKNKKTYTLYSTITHGGKKYKVTKIGKKAFANKTKLTSIKLPSTIKEIGNSAFAGCTKLKSVTIPKNVTKIGKKAFYGCSKLKTIKIKGTKVKSIGKAAFKKVGKKAKIYVPKSKEKAYKKLLKNKYDKKTKIVRLK